MKRKYTYQRLKKMTWFLLKRILMLYYMSITVNEQLLDKNSWSVVNRVWTWIMVWFITLFIVFSYGNLHQEQFFSFLLRRSVRIQSLSFTKFDEWNMKRFLWKKKYSQKDKVYFINKIMLVLFLTLYYFIYFFYISFNHIQNNWSKK